MTNPTRNNSRIKIIKRADRAETRGTAQISATMTAQEICCAGSPYAIIIREELCGKYLDMRRAFLAFEKFVRVDCGIEI